MVKNAMLFTFRSFHCIAVCTSKCFCDDRQTPAFITEVETNFLLTQFKSEFYQGITVQV